MTPREAAAFRDAILGDPVTVPGPWQAYNSPMHGTFKPMRAWHRTDLFGQAVINIRWGRTLGCQMTAQEWRTWLQPYPPAIAEGCP